MTRRAATLIGASLLLMLGACQNDTADAPAPGTDAGAADPAETSVSPVPDAGTAQERAAPSATVSGGANAVAEKTDRFEFKYAWPAEAGAIPALATLLAADRAAKRAEIDRVTTEDQREAKKGGWDFRSHYHDQTWKRVANLPGYLSLSADIATYGGGAHGNMGYDSLIWDKAAGKRVFPLTMFTSLAAFNDAVQPAFCDELDRRRAARRGVPPVRDQEDGFNACIDPTEQTVLLGSSNGQQFDRMTIMVGPYAAGPYAEGTYTVNLPITPALLRVVKPAYKAAFRAG